MSERQASFLICDDLLVSLNGKFFLHGVYTGDLLIATEEAKLNQLVLLLQVSTPTQKPFRQLHVIVSLPGEETPRTVDLMPLLPIIISLPGRTMSSYKLPVPIISPNLKAGPIEIRLTHEEGEVFVGRQWVMGPAQAQEFQKQIRPGALGN
jgi:hypothetical protein